MKHKKIVALEGVLNFWEVKLPDGRRAEVAALIKKEAAEQASAIWGMPASWVMENARIRAVSK